MGVVFGRGGLKDQAVNKYSKGETMSNYCIVLANHHDKNLLFISSQYDDIKKVIVVSPCDMRFFIQTAAVFAPQRRYYGHRPGFAKTRLLNGVQHGPACCAPPPCVEPTMLPSVISDHL